MKLDHLLCRFVIGLAGLCLTACTTAMNPQDDPIQIDASAPPSLVELAFDSHGSRLNGLIYQANGPGPHPTIVLLHGFPGNEKNLDIAQDLRRVGFNVVFFHYRGAWGSGGAFRLVHTIEDVASVTADLRMRAEALRVDPNKLILLGHSMGGFTSLHAAARDPQIMCAGGLAAADFAIIGAAATANPELAAGFSSYTDTLDMLAGYDGAAAMDEIESAGDSFALARLAPQLAGKSILLLAADQDTSVPPESFHTPLIATFEAQSGLRLTHDVLPGDHSFSWSRRALSEKITAWAKTCA